MSSQSPPAHRYNPYDALDRRSGNGSSEQRTDVLDETTIFSNEWGSQASTTFNPDDTDGKGRPIPRRKQRRLRRLYKWHNGKGERSRKSDIRQSHIINDAKTFFAVLELPDSQQQRVLTILKELDIQPNNLGGHPYEHVILAICSLVADEALSRTISHTDNPSLDERLHYTDRFRELMNVVEMDDATLRDLRTIVREKSEHF